MYTVVDFDSSQKYRKIAKGLAAGWLAGIVHPIGVTSYNAILTTVSSQN